MNKMRRKEIFKVIQLLNKLIDSIPETPIDLLISKIEELIDAIQNILDEEEAVMDGIPENLQSGSVYEKSEDACWNLSDAISELEELDIECTKSFAVKPHIEVIHAGLECGILSDKLPGLECVSIGPQMHDIHTSRERLEIASTERTWNFLLETLKNL